MLIKNASLSSIAMAADSPTYQIAFVNTHPIQYFAPLYSYLTQKCRLDTTALYLSDFSLKGGADPGFRKSVKWDVDLLGGYTAEFIGDKKASRRRIGGFFSMVAPELWTAIRQGKFDAVIIHGHNLAAHHIAQAACLSSGTPAFSRGETHLELTRPTWRALLRKPLLKMHYRGFDGFLAIGSANAEYYRSMGIENEQIFRVPYAVDNDRFINASIRARKVRPTTRAKLGLDHELPAILYASKFDRRKRPDDLLTAFTKLQQEGTEAQLVLVGSGAMELELKSRVASEGIRNVIFPGFINQSELPAVYAASDVFVLPSSNEPWGLVVNEAMCASLPIVLSSEIGCAKDLVEDGVNGATFTAGDVAGLADALRPILTNNALRETQGKESLSRIKRWSFAECGAGIRTAIEAARARRSS